MNEKKPTTDRLSFEGISVCVLGDTTVGKSSLVLRFIHDRFFEVYDPTRAERFYHNVELNGQTYELGIFDTVYDKEEQLDRNSVDHILRCSDAFLLCYSCESKASLDGLRRYWDRIVSVRGLEIAEKRTIIVATKIDIPDTRREVSETVGISFTQTLSSNHHHNHNSLKHVATSAKDGTNVKMLFVSAAQLHLSASSSDLNSNNNHSSKKPKLFNLCLIC